MAWAHSQKVPDAECKLLLLILADYASNHDEAGFTCWPSISRLSSDCLLCENTIRKRLKQLAECGVLTIEHRTSAAGDHASHRFRLSIPMNHLVHGVNHPPAWREPPPGSCREPEPISTEPVNEPCTHQHPAAKEAEATCSTTPATTTATRASRRKPSSIQECLAMAQTVGMSDSDAKCWFRDMEASNWSKVDGTPFGNWPREMAMARDRLRQNHSPVAPSTPRFGTPKNGF